MKHARHEPPASGEQLRQSQRMMLLGELAARVAHDLNNVISISSAYAELVLRRPDVDRTTLRQVGEMREALGRAARLTDQLLRMGRGASVPPQLLDVGEAILAVEGMLGQLAGPEVELTIRTVSAAPPVIIDRAGLEQMVMNLVSNARDAMQGRGRLAIEVSGVDVDSYDHALITVADSGAGMDEATKQRLFEPFFTTKPPGSGTGLGLAMALELVTASGGRISVESALGEGTTFRILLPCAGRNP
jgi:signal transduction histidine kinase